MPHLGMLRNPLKKLLHPDPEAGDFQKLISSSLCKGTYNGKHFREDPFSSFYVKLLTDKQTNEKSITDRGLVEISPPRQLLTSFQLQ